MSGLDGVVAVCIEATPYSGNFLGGSSSSPTRGTPDVPLASGVIAWWRLAPEFVRVVLSLFWLGSSVRLGLFSCHVCIAPFILDCMLDGSPSADSVGLSMSQSCLVIEFLPNQKKKKRTRRNHIQISRGVIRAERAELGVFKLVRFLNELEPSRA